MFLFSLLFSISLAFADPAPTVARDSLVAPYAYQGGGIPVAFLDADGTIRASRGLGFAPMIPEEVRVLPGVPEKIAELNRQGYFVAIVSNQSGPVSRSSVEQIERTMIETVRQAETAGGRINYFTFSKEVAEDKPGVVLFERLEQKLTETFGAAARINRSRSFMVGDAAYLRPEPGRLSDIRPDGLPGFDHANFDRRFAEKAQIKFHESDEFFGWRELGFTRLPRSADVDRYNEERDRRLRLGVSQGCKEGFAVLASP